ncbi:MAG TPA: acetylglutamate kinase [Candidatus Polarisedimenticolaceae bacterium]|nr:acetylglutamate kinase [Candidatus Polarisedimenticolaceae bacterium]
MSASAHAAIAALKGTLRYVRAYRHEIFVVKLGGEILSDAAALDGAAAQIALLTSLGIRIVVVHGGGPQASALSRRLGHEPRLVAGRRVTGDVDLEVATYVYAGRLNVDALSALRRHGVKAVGLSGVDAELLAAHRRPPRLVRLDDGTEEVVDFGHVGEIDDVDPAIVLHLLDGGFVPVVASLAGDADGAVYNVNADTVAEALAVALAARKLVFLTGTRGLLRDPRDPSSLVTFADAGDLAPLLVSGAVASGMRPKVEACLRAAARGVERTHIVDGRAPDALLVEVFTGEGSGTMIVHRKAAAAALEPSDQPA